MQLYLLRHGDAVESATLHDSERPLSDLGIRQAQAAGRFLHSLSISPQAILFSPLLRARQTAEQVNLSLQCRSISSSEHLTPNSDPRNLLNDLNATTHESLLLVGHQPFLGNLIALLLGARRDLRIEIKKGTLASLDVPRPLKRSTGTLQWIVTVEQMMLVR